MPKRYSCDVLIIGSGGAGLMAAYEAAKHGVRVAVVNKGPIQHTGATIMANGSMAAVGKAWKLPNDSKEMHFRDVISGGRFLNNQEIAHRIVYEASAVMEELEQLGAYFERNADGKTYALRTDGGHSYARSLFVEDRIGRELVRTLVGEIFRRQIPVYENIMMTRIVRSKGDRETVCGAIGIDLFTQQFVIFECPSIVLATGGVGYAYENSDNPIDLTGDGFALALECGLNLVDMEFIQFYPLGFLWPPAMKGLSGAYINHVHLYNAEGQRFLKKYSPVQMELTTRDVLAGAMIREIREGRGSPHGGVYADFRHLPPHTIEQEAPGLCTTYRNIGFDWETQRLEVAPTAHFTMGGIEVDADWSTKLPGLYGAGEVCGGVHGANRVSQNALTDAVVSGKIAGRNAAYYALLDHGNHHIDPQVLEIDRIRLKNLYDSKDGMDVAAYRTALRKILWEKIGVLRERKGLEDGINQLNSLANIPQKLCTTGDGLHQEAIQALENQNMVEIAIAIALSALNRCESRGAHIRTDYPMMDNNRYLKNTLIKKSGGDFYLAMRDVAFTFWTPDLGGASDEMALPHKYK